MWLLLEIDSLAVGLEYANADIVKGLLYSYHLQAGDHLIWKEETFPNVMIEKARFEVATICIICKLGSQCKTLSKPCQPKLNP